jgi:hypothetical protein
LWCAPLWGAVVAGLLTGCGRAQPPAAPALEFTRQMWNVDEKHQTVRVVGEVINRGAQPVREVEIHAALIGAGGANRGENMVLVTDLRPGEPRVFALNVTSHGGILTVQLSSELPRHR